MKRIVLLFTIAAFGACDPGGSGASKKTEPPAKSPVPPKADRAALQERAQKLADRVIIADGHVDLPYRLGASKNEAGDITEDISKRTEKGDFDFVRARAGGLDAPFMSIYVPASYQKKGGAKKFADSLIDMVESFPQKWPDKFALARNPADIRRNFERKLISLPMGIENGAAIEDQLKNVEHFFNRGIRYITLTHSKDNQIGDSSYDTSATWKGLSPFGRKVVAEMNRLGILVDISHVSDNTFYQVLDVAKVPVIASHSSLRHFTVDFERNMSDDMLVALKENGGVVMVNFGSTFVSDKSRHYYDQRRSGVMAAAWRNKVKDDDDSKMKELAAAWTAKHPRVHATVDDVADHIDRVVKFAGVDHVGFGSDFDGVGDSLPTGLKDASQYPNLIRVLLERGYSEEDIEKMASGNLFRVWEAAEKYAASQAR